MSTRYVTGARKLAVAALLLACSLSPLRAQDATTPSRRTLSYHGVEREYFVSLPPGFDGAKPYWLLAVVGGVNGRTFFLARGISSAVAESGFEAIVVSPSFPDEDLNAIRFPALGEGDFLEEVVKALRAEYPLRPRLLVTGYSRGGQFAHRFALAHPELVEAVAPLASGTWTTPDGRLLVEELGEVKDPHAFLSRGENANTVPDRLRDLFEPRVAAVAASKASAASTRIPFLVMCGTLDSRLPIAEEFARSLQGAGYQVEVEWPRTPHSCSGTNPCPEYAAEFRLYSRKTVEFFHRVTQAR